MDEQLLKFQTLTVAAFLWAFLHCTSCFSCSLNHEGLALLSLKKSIKTDPFNALYNWDCFNGDFDHCSWFGVECSDGKVVALKLRDLCLEGTLPPELGMLTYVKEIILRNNSFSGVIPEEIRELKELELLDLGCNNFSGPFPLDLANNLSLSILLLDDNKYIRAFSPEIYDLKTFSENQMGDKQLGIAASRDSCDNRLNSWDRTQHGDFPRRRLHQWLNFIHLTDTSRNKNAKRSAKSRRSSSLSPSPSPSPELSPAPFRSAEYSSSHPTNAPSPSQSDSLAPSRSPELSPLAPLFPKAQPPAVFLPEEFSPPSLTPSIVSSTNESVKDSDKSKNRTIIVICGAVGGPVLAIFLVLFICCRRNKIGTVKPWTTGLSGQLQKAFITGVPKLHRSELVTACEDFSNIIGYLADGTVYKGTLSSGVEIAVVSKTVKSAKEWPKNSEALFRNKIETLSKINHKNFINLIGFCEEVEPFTRMMVFEYAPNGSLFEHLHIKESEHLDWKTRLRIAMGMACCLEYMHNLTPPIAHGNLQSACLYLTEDYAAKISDFSFWNEVITEKMGSGGIEHLQTSSADPEADVFSFGVVLLEMITGRLAYSSGNSSVVDWAFDHLAKGKPLREMVDPTLSSFKEEELEKLIELVESCLQGNPRQRPTMRDISSKLQEITNLSPDGANPKTSPLWWAELEILSTASS